jgi:hypothetical protein
MLLNQYGEEIISWVGKRGERRREAENVMRKT